MAPLFITASDGRQLAADLFVPEAPLAAPKKVALMASAMGVKRQWYRRFAAHLASQGVAVLTLDYRGIGESLVGSLRAEPIDLVGWAQRDLQAGLEFLRGRFPGAPLVWIGHSVGGQLLGVMPEAQLGVERAVFIASQSGYWRNWRGKHAAAIYLLWNGLIPITTAVTGKLPMRAFGQGEDVPRQVARQWAEWGRHPRYIMKYADGRPELAFARFAGPICAFAMTDDAYAPPPSVKVLLDYYAQAKAALREVSPAQLGVARIGHFDFFRERYRDTLWREVIDFALASAP